MKKSYSFNKNKYKSRKSSSNHVSSTVAGVGVDYGGGHEFGGGDRGGGDCGGDWDQSIFHIIKSYDIMILITFHNFSL